MPFCMTIETVREKYQNRELSWLAFNERVLQEAANEQVPLVERMKYLGIFSNNLDEFFRVRVATIRRMISLEKKDKVQLGINKQNLKKISITRLFTFKRNLIKPTVRFKRSLRRKTFIYLMKKRF
jgi:polyphosphate kinase